MYKQTSRHKAPILMKGFTLYSGTTVVPLCVHFIYPSLSIFHSLQHVHLPLLHEPVHGVTQVPKGCVDPNL
jgi:hypothetical protein